MDISISQAGVIIAMLLLVINGLSVLLHDIRHNRRQHTHKSLSKGKS